MVCVDLRSDRGYVNLGAEELALSINTEFRPVPLIREGMV
jgi:hypothetical protein